MDGLQSSRAKTMTTVKEELHGFEDLPSVSDVKSALNKCSQVIDLNRRFCQFLFDKDIVTTDSQHFVSLEEYIVKLGCTGNCTTGVFYCMTFECPDGMLYNRVFESGNCRGFYTEHFQEFCTTHCRQDNSKHQGIVVWEINNESDVEVQKKQEASKPRTGWRARPDMSYKKYVIELLKVSSSCCHPLNNML